MKQVLLAAAVAAVLAAAPRSSAAGPTDPVPALDAYIEQQRQAWEVPGMAVAIVKDDKVVLLKGYGVRKLGDRAPVDAHTTFAIGSTSKAFTAAVVASVVDAGKLALDDKIVDRLPGFQLADAWVTREVTLRDALNHRVGLPRADSLAFTPGLTRDQMIARMRYLAPSKGFRKDFQYSNLMFLVAGQTAATAAGKSWDALVAERIFRPLGMKDASTSVRALRPGGDWATPHTRLDGKLAAVAYRNIDVIGPAGSINASATDMAAWLRFQLGDGSFAGKPVLSSGTFAELHTPQASVPAHGGRAHLAAYAFGWIVQDHLGKAILWHNGRIDGMHAAIALVPEEHLGMVVLQNSDEDGLPESLMYAIADAYLGATDGRDWSSEALAAAKPLRDLPAVLEQQAQARRVAGTRPSLPLAKYAGIFHDDLYGDVTVTQGKDGLVFSVASLVADASHWNYDSFELVWRDHQLGREIVTFELDATGAADEVVIGVGDDEPVRFRRVPPTLTPRQLARFVGTYKGPGATLTVALQGTRLTLSVPGQPLYTLEVLGETSFHIAPLPDAFTVEFTGKNGAIDAAETDQPGAHVRWERVP